MSIEASPNQDGPLVAQAGLCQPDFFGPGLPNTKRVFPTAFPAEPVTATQICRQERPCPPLAYCKVSTQRHLDLLAERYLRPWGGW